MDCREVERKARTIVRWLLGVGAFVMVNTMIIVASLSSAGGGAWWVGHAALLAVGTGIFGTFCLAMWLAGEISFCRRK